MLLSILLNKSDSMEDLQLMHSHLDKLKDTYLATESAIVELGLIHAFALLSLVIALLSSLFLILHSCACRS